VRLHIRTFVNTLRKDPGCGSHGTRRKNSANVRRNGIAFQDAAGIFDGPTVERTDDRYDYGEVRIYAIGLVNGIEITVIYTDRDRDERHIISAWRSEPDERRHFWNRLED
jgi:uncharacterized DUF497 family protein